MKLTTKSFFLVIGLLAPFILKAQQLTLRNAIDTALTNNFDIQIARNNVDISKMNNSYGMAGGLPYITANVGDNASISSINQRFTNGSDTSFSGMGENALNAGISGGIVLFNGFRITATKERLSGLQNLSEIQLNQQIQNTIAGIMFTYFDIIRQQNYLKIIQNSLDVSNQKLDIIKVRNQVGMADAVVMLQAQTDVNSAQQSLELQKLVIEQSKADLKLQMNSKNHGLFAISDTIVVDESLQIDSILNYLERNPQFQIANQQIIINEHILKEISALRYPTIKLNAGYDFYQANLNKNAMTFNQNYGPTAGINMQIPIFNGNIYKIQKDVAKINMDNSRLEKESIHYSLASQASKLYNSYSATIRQIEEQKKNCEMTKQLVDVVMQKFQVSQTTILEVKAAQSSFENAAYMLVNLLFSAKVAEIELKQLTYSLTF